MNSRVPLSAISELNVTFCVNSGKLVDTPETVFMCVPHDQN